jgi:membrane-associated phospholipid phosphatase
MPAELPLDRNLLLAAVVCGLLACLAIPTFDAPVSKACLAGDVPGDVRKGLGLTEVFAHGVGVGFICLAFFALDSRKHLLPRLICLPLCTGLSGSLAKLVLARSRPNQLSAEDFPAAIETFQGFPGSFSSELQSMPSGHTAAAVGLAIALSRLYPRSRLLFAAFAGLAACQRIAFGAHFVSDTLAGAALAFGVASLLANRLFWDAGFDHGTN